MRGHPAITVKLFLTWTAGVLAYGLVCAGPPGTMMATRRDCALAFDTDAGGRHASRCEHAVHLAPPSQRSAPSQRSSPSPPPSSWRKMKKRRRRRIKAQGSCRRCISTRDTLATYRTPAQCWATTVWDTVYKGVIAWQGLYLSADGIREARRTPIKAQGLGRADALDPIPPPSSLLPRGSGGLSVGPPSAAQSLTREQLGQEGPPPSSARPHTRR